MNRILGTAVNDSQWQQAQLPVDLGGLDLSSAWDHACPCCASYLAVQDLQLHILDKSVEESPAIISQPWLLLYLGAKMGWDGGPAQGKSKVITPTKLEDSINIMLK